MTQVLHPPPALLLSHTRTYLFSLCKFCLAVYAETKRNSACDKAERWELTLELYDKMCADMALAYGEKVVFILDDDDDGDDDDDDGKDGEDDDRGTGDDSDDYD